MKSLRNILKYIFPKYWKNAGANFVFVLLSVLFSLFSLTMIVPFMQILFERTELVTESVPFHFSTDAVMHNFYYYMSKIVIENGQSAALAYVSIFIALMVFLKASFMYLSRFVMPPLYSGVVFDIRNNIYDKILRLPMSYFSDERKGDIISRMTADMQEIEGSVIRSIDVLFKEPLTILIYLGSLIFMSPQLTLFVFVLLPVSGFIIGRIGRNLRKSSRLAQSKLGDIISIIEETLGGLRIIKGFNAEDRMNKHFVSENSFYKKIGIKMSRRRDLASPLSEFLGTVAAVAVLYYGGTMVLKGSNSITPEVLIAYIAIFSQVLSPAKAFSTAYYNIQKGLASQERIEKILEAELLIKDKPNIIEKYDFNSQVKYNDIYFKYEDDYVISGISLTLKKGQAIALVGQSGSGKSTMADLLPRFYDVTKGSITIDDIDIRDMKMTQLRRLMGIVNQESILFNDTVFNNIAFGVEDATAEQVEEAAKIANAHKFILEMPNGYHSSIGDRGGKLSGGQRQRISIARAILANPPIMILDEATSALDTESEKLVQDSLNNLMKNRTSIVIAHRLSTVVHADLICVLHEGKIVEKGTHDELIAKKGQYKKLHDIQMFA